MESEKILEHLLMSISKDLVNMIVNAGVLFLLVSIFAIGFTIAVRITIEGVFLQRKLNKIFSWFINLINVIIMSFIVMLLFKGFNHGKPLYLGITYLGMIVLVSWAINIICYNLLVKKVLIYGDISMLKTKTKKLEVEIETKQLINKLLELEKLNNAFEIEIELEKLK